MGNLQCTPKQDINQAVQSKRDIGDKFYKGRVAERVFKLLYNALSINFETHSNNFFIITTLEEYQIIAVLKAEQNKTSTSNQRVID